MDEDQVFSAEDLANADGRDLEFLVNSRAYQNYFQPLIIGLIQRCHEELADPTIQRRWRKPDGYLRGAIWVAKAILNAPTGTLAIRAQRLAEEEREEKQEQKYEVEAAGGQYGRASAPISPTDPIQ